MTTQGQTGRGMARAMREHSLDQARGRGFTAMQFNFMVAGNERAVPRTIIDPQSGAPFRRPANR